MQKMKADSLAALVQMAAKASQCKERRLLILPRPGREASANINSTFRAPRDGGRFTGSTTASAIAPAMGQVSSGQRIPVLREIGRHHQTRIRIGMRRLREQLSVLDSREQAAH